MNPRQFLKVGGAVLVVVGVLGFFGIIGPTASQSLFGEAWWFDNTENWAHLVLGVAGILAAYFFPATLKRYLVITLGVLGVVTGLYSLVLGQELLGANLENPLDTILHLAVGGWALYAVFGTSQS